MLKTKQKNINKNHFFLTDEMFPSSVRTKYSMLQTGIERPTQLSVSNVEFETR